MIDVGVEHEATVELPEPGGLRPILDAYLTTVVAI